MASTSNKTIYDNKIKDLFTIVELMKRFHLYNERLGRAGISREILQRQAEKIIEDKKVELESINCKPSIDEYAGNRFLTFDTCNPNSCLEITISKGKKTERTILQFAVEHFSETDELVKANLKGVIFKLIACCPKLILSLNNQGVTPLHSVIVMQLIDIAQEMLKKIDTKANFNTEGKVQLIDEKEVETEHKEIFDINSDHLTGTAERGRILGAGPVFHIAVLTLNTEMFDVFYGFNGDECIKSLNKLGDNLFHSLIRYSSRAPSKIDDILSMLEHLTSRKFRDATNDLWKQRNTSEGLTPLQLAAKKGQDRIFEFVMSIEMLYFFKDEDEDCFDVTEIDTIPMKHEMSQSSTTYDGSRMKDEDVNTHKSVLHILRSQVPDKIGLSITNLPPVKAVIDIKWRTYRWYIWTWFVLHVIIMSFSIWYAIVRASLTNPLLEGDNPKKLDTALELGICLLLYGIFCIVMQVVRNVNKLRRKRYSKFYFKYMSASLIFPWLFSLLGILIVLDFSLAVTLSTYKNFLLPYIMILGWCITLYFLQVFNYFSVFTVMLQGLISITIQFAVVMALFLLGFSAAAYLSMHDAELEDDDDTFKHFGKTIFKLLTVMVGLGDIDEVFEATYPALSISVLVLFVLLTTILLLNALIAYMSEICGWLLEYSNPGGISSTIYARLQRAYVFIQLEDLLPVALLVHGQTPEKELLTPFPDSERKYVSLRPMNESTPDSPVEFVDKRKGIQKIYPIIEEEIIETTSNNISNEIVKPTKSTLIPKNKVFPYDTMTLEITEITQAHCSHDCTCCDNRDIYSIRNLGTTIGPDRLSTSLRE